MNRVEVSLYTDNDSIATIEESIITKKLSTIHRQNEVNYNSLSIQLSISAIKVEIGDEVSVASLVTMESLLLKQNKTNLRINKIDATINQIL